MQVSELKICTWQDSDVKKEKKKHISLIKPQSGAAAKTDPVPEEMPEMCPICPNNTVVLGWSTSLSAGRDTARHEGKIHTVPLTASASLLTCSSSGWVFCDLDDK